MKKLIFIIISIFFLIQLNAQPYVPQDKYFDGEHTILPNHNIRTPTIFIDSFMVIKNDTIYEILIDTSGRYGLKSAYSLVTEEYLKDYTSSSSGLNLNGSNAISREGDNFILGGSPLNRWTTIEGNNQALNLGTSNSRLYSFNIVSENGITIHDYELITLRPENSLWLYQDNILQRQIISGIGSGTIDTVAFLSNIETVINDTKLPFNSKYNFNPTTSNIDPGIGFFSLNSTNILGVTQINIDLNDYLNQYKAPILELADTGSILVISDSEINSYLSYRVTGHVDRGGYIKYYVEYISDNLDGSLPVGLCTLTLDVSNNTGGSGSGGGVTEAPINGNGYIRKDGGWAQTTIDSIYNENEFVWLKETDTIKAIKSINGIQRIFYGGTDYRYGLGGTMDSDTEIPGAGFDMNFGSNLSRFHRFSIYSSNNFEINTSSNILLTSKSYNWFIDGSNFRSSTDTLATQAYARIGYDSISQTYNTDTLYTSIIETPDDYITINKSDDGYSGINLSFVNPLGYIYTAGQQRLAIGSNYISNPAVNWSIQSRAATLTVPNFLPDYDYQSTGIGSIANNLSFISNGTYMLWDGTYYRSAADTLATQAYARGESGGTGTPPSLTGNIHADTIFFNLTGNYVVDGDTSNISVVRSVAADTHWFSLDDTYQVTAAFNSDSTWDSGIIDSLYVNNIQSSIDGGIKIKSESDSIYLEAQGLSHLTLWDEGYRLGTGSGSVYPGIITGNTVIIDGDETNTSSNIWRFYDDRIVRSTSIFQPIDTVATHSYVRNEISNTVLNPIFETITTDTAKFSDDTYLISAYIDSAKHADTALYALNAFDSLYHSDTKVWLLNGDTIPKADSTRDVFTANDLHTTNLYATDNVGTDTVTITSPSDEFSVIMYTEDGGDAFIDASDSYLDITTNETLTLRSVYDLAQIVGNDISIIATSNGGINFTNDVNNIRFRGDSLLAYGGTNISTPIWAKFKGFIGSIFQGEKAILDTLNLGGHDIRFNESVGMFEMRTGQDSVIWQGALEDLEQVYNNKSDTIKNGTPFHFEMAIGDSIATAGISSANNIYALSFQGLITGDISPNDWGYGCTRGDVHGIPTDHLSLMGAVYLSNDSTTTNTKVDITGEVIVVGGCLKVHPTNGTIRVSPSLALKRIPFTKSYNWSSQSINAGTYYEAGSYETTTTDVTLGTLAATETFGISDNAYEAHPWVVVSGAGSVDAGIVGLTVTGTATYDNGTMIPGHIDTLITDITSVSINNYFEAEKFNGTVTYAFVTISGSPTTASLTFNRGYAKYDDFWNNDFYVTGLECTWRGGQTDATGFDIELLHHKATGWTYAATGFIPGDGAIATRSIDQTGFLGVTLGSVGSWKRDDLNVFITGNNGGGLIFRIKTGANSTIQNMQMHIPIILD